jgi:DNA-binding response OmpR family regulator
MATILTIDDSSLAHHVVRLALGRSNHTLVSARDGVEGVETARRIRPDVLIVGLSLPGMDGVEVLRAIRESQLECPALMLGAGASEWTCGVCEKLGATAFIERPIEAARIRREVENALDDDGRGRSAA